MLGTVAQNIRSGDSFFKDYWLELGTGVSFC
jgi:hypothetical protein